MINGYDWVSTQDQNLDSQIEQLIKYGVDGIVKEKISGVSKQKQQLDELLFKIATGDTLVVTRMDRLELDCEMIREKQRLGIKLAKQKGKYRGRVKKYTDKPPGMNHAMELRKTTDKTVKEICTITGVSQAAFYRKLKEMKKSSISLFKY